VVIELPNGDQTVATKHGTVALEDGKHLRDVLLVPNLSCNLVSIARITKDLNCSVTFFYDGCVLQDRISRMPIGMGEQ